MNDLTKVLGTIEEMPALKDPLEINKVKPGTLSVGASNNIVKKDVLRKVQYRTIDEIAESLRKTFGPFGSNTLILKGSDAQSLTTTYSKDGHKCLKNILYNNPIELSIQTQLVDIVAAVDNTVGDGTTSATLLSSEIFKRLCTIEAGMEKSYKYVSPYQLSRDFQCVATMIKNKIMSHKRPFTLQDAYDIAFISTNGNGIVSKEIADLYNQYGLDVYIETGISNTTDSIVKEFDGLTLDEGYSDAAYINTHNGKSDIRNAKIYAFQDPIDTVELCTLFDKIIDDNIIQPIWGEDEEAEVVPTVIIAPKISRDMSESIRKLVDALYTYDSQGDITRKPPILVVTNLLGGNYDIYADVARLCGCRMIKKYIDAKLQEEDIKRGLAPTPDTIHQFAGSCEQVVADISSTKFVNPKEMFTDEVDNDGNPIPTVTFTNLIKFLEAELKDAAINKDDDRTIHGLKKRLQSLKANMIEYDIGGLTPADRDAVKDLVEDAVKSCRSAYNDGVGYAANFEGLRACLELIDEAPFMDVDEDTKDRYLCILKHIAKAYVDVQSKLYEDDPEFYIKRNLEEGSPFNLTTRDWDGKVITSIKTDIKIIEAISKLITLMVTTEQCYVQVPALNRYTMN